MEYRKKCLNPREMADDALLCRLLDESESVCCQYGIPSHPRNKSCGCRPGQVNLHPPVSAPTPRLSQLENEHEDCGCDEKEQCGKKNCLSDWHLAMSYTPDQEWRNLFDTDEALTHGTLFCELEFPFYPGCRTCR